MGRLNLMVVENEYADELSRMNFGVRKDVGLTIEALPNGASWYEVAHLYEPNIREKIVIDDVEDGVDEPAFANVESPCNRCIFNSGTVEDLYECDLCDYGPVPVVASQNDWRLTQEEDSEVYFEECSEDTDQNTDRKKKARNRRKADIRYKNKLKKNAQIADASYGKRLEHDGWYKNLRIGCDRNVGVEFERTLTKGRSFKADELIKRAEKMKLFT